MGRLIFLLTLPKMFSLHKNGPPPPPPPITMHFPLFTCIMLAYTSVHSHVKRDYHKQITAHENHPTHWFYFIWYYFFKLSMAILVIVVVIDALFTTASIQNSFLFWIFMIRLPRRSNGCPFFRKRGKYSSKIWLHGCCCPTFLYSTVVISPLP